MNSLSSRAPQRPTWHYAAYGAAAVAIAVALSMLASIGEFLRGATPVWVIPLALGIGAVLGATGGLTYGFVGRRLRRMGKLGPYLAGIVTVSGYMLPIAAVVALFWHEAPPDLSPSVALAALAVTILLFGLIVGHFLRPTSTGAV